MPREMTTNGLTDSLRRDILTGQLAPGEWLVEVELAQRDRRKHAPSRGRGQLRRVLRSEPRLHDRLREISRHTVASDLIGNLRDRAAHPQFRLALQPGRPAQSLLELEAIVEAVVSGDENASAAAMEQHVASVLHVLRHWDDLRVSLSPRVAQSRVELE